MGNTSQQQQKSQADPLSKYIGETMAGYVLGPNFANYPAKYYPQGQTQTTYTPTAPVYNTSVPSSTPSTAGLWGQSIPSRTTTTPSTVRTGTVPAAGSSYPFNTAGYLPGSILPNYQDLLNQPSYFDTLSGANANPILSEALKNIMNPTMPNINFGGGAGGGGAAGLGTLIGSSHVQNALQGLENPQSVFDTMSGGPIVDEIAKRTDTMTQAVGKKSEAELARQIDIATANLGGQGLISSSQVLQERGRITNDIMNDYNQIISGAALENTKYLGNLAMQDALMKSNNLQSILQQAMVEKGINADYAATMAKVAADEAIAKAQIQANLYINQQNQYQNILGMGAQDYATTQAAKNKMQLLPIDLMTATMTGIPSVSSGSASSKSY